MNFRDLPGLVLYVAILAAIVLKACTTYCPSCQSHDANDVQEGPS